MADDILGLEIVGEVTISRFALSVSRLRDLITSLTQEIAGEAKIDWLIESLEGNSATQRYKGIAHKPADQEKVSEIIKAYGEIGQAYERHQPAQQSVAIIEKTDKLVALIDERIEYLRFETAQLDALVRAAGVSTGVELPERAMGPEIAWGAVEGRVQAMSSRGSNRFTLYDLVFDRGVSCYLREDQADLMIDVWGEQVVVEGTVRRDPITGRPLTVREIRAITPVPEREPGGYRHARGVAPSLSGLSAEDAIRRIRDAE